MSPHQDEIPGEVVDLFNSMFSDDAPDPEQLMESLIEAAEHSQPRSRKVGRGKARTTIRLEEAAREALRERHPMTLRQLFYVLVSRGHLPKTEAGYNKLKRIMKERREVGACPWGWLADHTRAVIAARTFDGVEGLLDDAARLYRRDLMRQQPYAIQVWAESDSVGSIISPVADRYTIPVYVGRGYASVGYLWSAAEDIAAAIGSDKDVVILHVGDYDPSGEDIFRDVAEKLDRYTAAILKGIPADQAHGWTVGDHLVVKRIALTEDQVLEHDLPARPPKKTDSRSKSFDGIGAVEVEALPVDVLTDLVEDAIQDYIDEDALAVVQKAEQSEREIAARIAGTSVERLLEVAS